MHLLYISLYVLIFLGRHSGTTEQWGISKNFERGRRRFISPVVIYCKCTQRTIRLLHGKRRLFGKKFWTNGGWAAAPTASPLNPPLQQNNLCRCIMRINRRILHVNCYLQYSTLSMYLS